MKRKLIMLRLLLCKGGRKRADILKKNNVFYKQGNNCYYHPVKIPSEPHLITLHNNVIIATNVLFVTHDIINSMISTQFKESLNIHIGKIEIFDNVFIGANSTILYNVKIGPNAIVSAGSVVTKDVPEGSIVGGVPAKVIGKYEEYVSKMKKYSRETNHLFESNKYDNLQKQINYFWGDNE